MKQFIAVAGNIGVGKSSLTSLLADRLGWAALPEAVDTNPYLAEFYADMVRWSLHSQLFFLSRRMRDLCALRQDPGLFIQDRSVYEDAEIFARNLYLQGYMSERGWQLYHDLYTTLVGSAPQPDLVIYLRAPGATLLDRIARRGRRFEQTITPEYLSHLDALYERWIARFDGCPVLSVATDEVDFVQRPEHVEVIARAVLERLGDATKEIPASQIHVVTREDT
jgi:deoxyadenosine/deoxycytidine kinase